MPIEVDSEIRIFSQEEFHALAHRVMGVVFGVHNDFGRLMEEGIYQQAIRRRCEADGIVPARREVEIKVRYGDFPKVVLHGLVVRVWVDGRIEDGREAEQCPSCADTSLPAVDRNATWPLDQSTIERSQEAICLHDIGFGRTAAASSLTMLIGNLLTIPANACVSILLELLADWGAFLQTSLYREAIIHFFGGPQEALRRIPIYDGNALLGTHEVCLIADDTALALTALRMAELK